MYLGTHFTFLLLLIKSSAIGDYTQSPGLLPSLGGGWETVQPAGHMVGFPGNQSPPLRYLKAFLPFFFHFNFFLHFLN